MNNFNMQTQGHRLNADGSILSARGLEKIYGDRDQRTEIFTALDFSIVPGDSVAIVGASGSGKSTLLHLLGGLDTPNRGQLNICGQSVYDLSPAKRGWLRNQSLGFVYQFHHLLPEFNALDNAAMPLMIRGVSDKKAREEAKHILAQVGLSHRWHHMPNMLSGGERQRVAIARALVTKPACILADEPTGNLDELTADQVFQLMNQLRVEHQTALVMVTHDSHLATQMQRQLRLERGRLVLV